MKKLINLGGTVGESKSNNTLDHNSHIGLLKSTFPASFYRIVAQRWCIILNNVLFD